MELRVKDLHEAETPHFYTHTILNVLYHLMHFCVKRDLEQARDGIVHFRAGFQQLLAEVGVSADRRKDYLRRSHFLNKQIRAVFENRNGRAEQLECARQRNYFLLRGYCRRHELRFQQARKLSSNDNLESVTKREDEHETNPVAEDPKDPDPDRPHPLPHDLPEAALLRFLLNSHFHIALMTPRPS